MSEETPTKNKLFKWEGKKEIYWIIGFALLFLLCFAYYKETGKVKDIMKTECYKDCAFQEGIKQIQVKHPGLMLQCNSTTRTCRFSGVLGNEFDKEMNEMKELNISFLPDDTNYSRKNSSED